MGGGVLWPKPWSFPKAREASRPARTGWQYPWSTTVWDGLSRTPPNAHWLFSGALHNPLDLPSIPPRRSAGRQMLMALF